MFSDIVIIFGMIKDSFLNELKNGKIIVDLIKFKNIFELDFKNKLILM